ncbi:MAG: hypothetical protein R2795_24970 [Saprospiraceae bacterium]
MKLSPKDTYAKLLLEKIYRKKHGRTFTRWKAWVVVLLALSGSLFLLEILVLKHFYYPYSITAAQIRWLLALSGIGVSLYALISQYLHGHYLVIAFLKQVSLKDTALETKDR